MGIRVHKILDVSGSTGYSYHSSRRAVYGCFAPSRKGIKIRIEIKSDVPKIGFAL
jgi:hypothetical protein